MNEYKFGVIQTSPIIKYYKFSVGTKMDFSERLEALMESHKVTIGHLSKETGISKSSLHGYLQGAEASLGNAVKLADYFDVSLDFLVTGKKDALSEELMRFAIHDGLYEVTVKKKIKK